MRFHKANKSKSVFEAKMVSALSALYMLLFKKLHVFKLWSKIQFFDNEEKKKWFEKSVMKETAAATQRVGKAEVAVERATE
jgi:hypothetical protein